MSKIVVYDDVWKSEAYSAYPEGCKCTDESCGWCGIYYNGWPTYEDAQAQWLREHP